MSIDVDLLPCLTSYVSAFCSSSLDKIKESLNVFPESIIVTYGESKTSLKNILIIAFQHERRYQNLQFAPSKSVFNRYEHHLHDAFSRIHSVCEELIHPYRRLVTGVLPIQIPALLNYLHYFCQIRCKLLSFFAIFSNTETDVCSSAESFSSALEDTLALNVPFNCLHSVAEPLVKMVRLELEILANLFKLQCQLSNLEFLDSILSLRSISLKLKKYSTRCNMITEPPTPFMNWLRDFHSLMLAKFTLYWHSIYHSISTKPIDVQKNLSKENPHIVLQKGNYKIEIFICRIQEFVEKHEGSNVAIFFDAHLQDFDYLGHSYVPPGAAGMYVKSSNAIPCIFTWPPTESNSVSRNDYSVIMRALHSLLSATTWKPPRQIVGQFEVLLGKTFFLQKLEKRYYMAIVVEDHHGSLAESDHIREFINQICDCIQLIDVAKALQWRS